MGVKMVRPGMHMWSCTPLFGIHVLLGNVGFDNSIMHVQLFVCQQMKWLAIVSIHLKFSHLLPPVIVPWEQCGLWFCRSGYHPAALETLLPGNSCHDLRCGQSLGRSFVKKKSGQVVEGLHCLSFIKGWHLNINWKPTALTMIIWLWQQQVEPHCKKDSSLILLCCWRKDWSVVVPIRCSTLDSRQVRITKGYRRQKRTWVGSGCIKLL